jgi:hypothetical protein
MIELNAPGHNREFNEQTRITYSAGATDVESLGSAAPDGAATDGAAK